VRAFLTVSKPGRSHGGIGTEDDGIAGRLRIIDMLSAAWRVGQAEDHSLRLYLHRAQKGHSVEVRNRRRILDLGSSQVCLPDRGSHLRLLRRKRDRINWSRKRGFTWAVGSTDMRKVLRAVLRDCLVAAAASIQTRDL
jgi:hypothetical protein